MSDDKKTALEEKWAATADEPAPDDVVDGGDTVTPEQPAETDRLRAEIAKLQDQVQRRQAELINFRRRTERERSERRESERAAVLAELLPAIDDFERAIAVDDENVAAYRQGVTLILKSLQDTLSRLGLERVEPEGEPFDPNVHEAVERQETLEVPDGHVVAVYKPGYRLGERLVRPAMVAVAASPAEDSGQRTSDDES